MVSGLQSSQTCTCRAHVQLQNQAFIITSKVHHRSSSSVKNTLKLIPTSFPRASSCRERFTIVAAGRRGSVIAAAATASEEQLPESREEAIAQAAAAVASHLPATDKSTNKKTKGGGSGAAGFTGAGRKLSVEIPVADESDAAALALARDLISALPSAWQRQFTIVQASRKVPTNETNTLPRVVSLSACASGEVDVQSAACLLVVAPRTDQIYELERALGGWRGAVVVVLNAEWAANGGEVDAGVPAEHTAFVRSIEAAYCFMPILIKAFVVSRQEGAVFRMNQGGASGGGGFGAKGTSSPWKIFMRKGQGWEAVGRMQRRPSNEDVEDAFYNASAAKSPLTQGAKFLRGLTQKKTD